MDFSASNAANLYQNRFQNREMSEVGAEVVHHDGAMYADGGWQSCLGQGEGVVLNIVSKNFMIKISTKMSWAM